VSLLLRDAFRHSLQVFHHALRESGDLSVVVAALTHDVGKATMPIGHEEEGARMLEGLVSEKTVWLVRNHIRVRYLINGDTKRLSKVQELLMNPWFPDLVMLTRWDKMGRNANHHVEYDREKIIARLQTLDTDR